jgi:3D (Asp-Asp-Asp) domain-containing protein
VLLARSNLWKALVTIVSALVFVGLLEVTMLDSRYVTLPMGLIEPVFDPTAPPAPGARLAFAATAYCKGLVTSAGVAPQRGIAAADPTLLPMGTIVQLDFRNDKYDGMYTILDVGPEIQGREVDLYMWSCVEAQQFGRMPVRMTVLRLGWNPRATSHGFFERLLNREPAPEVEPLPSRPLPIGP